MNRTILAALALSVVAAMCVGVTNAQQQPDWNKIEIKTTDLGNRTYMLAGQGGNITVAVGDEGILMVDGQFAPLSDKIKAAIKAISPLPIKYMVNTHYHRDHTGGNENFQKSGVTVVAHDNVRVRLAAGATSGLTGKAYMPPMASAPTTQTYFGGAVKRSIAT